MTPAPDLSPLDANPVLSDVAKTVFQNYKTYYLTKEQLTSLQEWVTKQKQVFNTP